MQNDLGSAYIDPKCLLALINKEEANGFGCALVRLLLVCVQLLNFVSKKKFSWFVVEFYRNKFLGIELRCRICFLSAVNAVRFIVLIGSCWWSKLRCKT